MNGRINALQALLNPLKTENTEPVWRWLWVFLFLAFLARLLGSTVDTLLRADEYYQYLEYAHRVVFGHGFIFWEQRLGVRTPLISIPAIIVLQLCKSLGLGHPDYYVPAVKFVNIMLSLSVPLGLYFFCRQIYSENIARAALVISCFWPELLLFSYRPLPEAYSTYWIFLALALFNPAAGARRIAVIGFSLALAAALRLQYVPVSFFFVGVFFLCLKSVRQKLFLLLGGALAVLFWGAVETVQHGYPYASMINYARFFMFPPAPIREILHDTPNPWYYHWLHLILSSAGLFVPVILYACLNFRKNWLILTPVIAVIFLHSALPTQASNTFISAPLLIALTAVAGSALAAKNQKKTKLGFLTQKTVVFIPLAIAAVYLSFFPFFNATLLLKLAVIWLHNLKKKCAPYCGITSIFLLPAVIICFIIGRQCIILPCPTMPPFSRLQGKILRR